MRSENSVKNSLYAIFGQAVSLLVGFVTRIAFVRILGEAYLGVNGVFYSVLSLLSLTELGMGAAFTYALYQPIADDDRERIGKLMNLYAIAYRFVALAVTLIGLLLIPFLPLILHDVPQIEHITLIYLLFLGNSALSYLFSYKRALLTAAQQDFRNSLNLTIFTALQNAAQLVILITTGSYILYLVIQLFCTLGSNLTISHTAHRQFPYLKKIKGLPEKSERRPIAQNVRAMLLTRLGSVAVTGTDNLLIATVGVILVGLYSNYLLLLQSVQTILMKVTEAVTASVGNLIVDREHTERRGAIYGDVTFAVAWMFGFSAIALDLLMGRFITIAFGEGLEIPTAAVHLMVLNFLIAGFRQPSAMFISAAGLFRQVKWRGIVEAIVNLASSILFLWLGMGLFGVLLGTTLSHLAVGLGWELWCVARHCVSGGARIYGRIAAMFVPVIAVAWIASSALCALLPEGILGFIAAAAIVVILPNALFLLFFHRTEPFAFFKGILKRIVSRIYKQN